MTTRSTIPGVVLRPVREDDLPFLAEVYAGTRREEVARLPWAVEEREAFLRQQFEAQHRHYQDHHGSADFLVVERGGEPVGRLYLDWREDEVRIVDIALLPAARGRGLGGALLREVLERAAEEGRVARIHVERENPALRLYRRLGFRVIDDRGVYLFLEWPPPPAQPNTAS